MSLTCSRACPASGPGGGARAGAHQPSRTPACSCLRCLRYFTWVQLYKYIRYGLYCTGTGTGTTGTRYMKNHREYQYTLYQPREYAGWILEPCHYAHEFRNAQNRGLCPKIMLALSADPNVAASSHCDSDLPQLRARAPPPRSTISRILRS